MLSSRADLPRHEVRVAGETPNQPAIRVRNLSKCYQIYNRPQDRLKQSILPRLRRLAGQPPTHYYREFWALKDVSLDIKRGETIGIIGRNGSGKSTLLQLICGTLSATSGSIEVNGRIGALLELGSGFDPQFTGRENVYLNGALLGLTRDEIDARFARIAAFADIGQFIDQPLRTYSSGMVVRLAFSVIANIDADVLLIDEALAVGDFVFIQKCMRFLREFQRNGTLVLVSHDTAAVINLCDRTIWLHSGAVRDVGVPQQICNEYLRDGLQSTYNDAIRLEAVTQPPVQAVTPGPCRRTPDPSTTIRLFENISNSSGWSTGHAQITRARLLDQAGDVLASALGGEIVSLEISATAIRSLRSPIVGFFVKDKLGQPLFGDNTYAYINQPPDLQPGQCCVVRFKFELPLLPNGNYSVAVAIATGTQDKHVPHHWLHDAAILTVSSDRFRHGLVGIPFLEVTFAVDG